MFDATKVDLVTVTPESDAVLLYIVASAEWTGNDAQLQSLQRRSTPTSAMRWMARCTATTLRRPGSRGGP